MEHKDWYSYLEGSIPRVSKGQLYYYILPDLTITCSRDNRLEVDNVMYESHNYFKNKEDAQHLANTFKRLSLIINTKRYNTERDIQEIIDYIDNEYPILKRDIDNYNRKYIL